MKESDWKIFKKIKEKSKQKFCEIALNDFRKVTDNENEAFYERYLRHYQLVQDRDKLMERLFDRHSRSKAWLQLLAIRSQGLADEELVAELTEEFQRRTDPQQHHL